MRRIGLIFIILIIFFCNTSAQETIDHWEMAVKAENTWKYMPGTSEPSANWINNDFDDASWSDGTGGFGYGDGDDGTELDAISSVYLRIKFNITDITVIEQAILLADFDDSFVAYLNGTEIARSNIAGTPPTYDQFADTENEAFLYQGQYPMEIILSQGELETLFINGENVLAVQVHNINATSSDLSSNFFLAVGLNTNTIAYQPVSSWFRAPLQFGASNLPIVKVDTDNKSILDEPKITATMGIIDNGPGNTNSVNDPFTDYDGTIGIEIRGSSSQSFPKKQYAVELWTESGQDTSATILGMPAEEDWILYAPYTDKSLIRNVLTFKFGADLGWYAPRTRLVEMYLNDQYRGVYVMTEKIKRDINRVDVSKLNPDENSGDDLTGGYIIKLDKFDGAAQGFGWDSPFTPINRVRQDQVIHFQYHYPKEDEITYQQQDYIRNFVTQFEEALAGPDFLHSKFGYRNYINVESFIDFAIINELTRNVDGYRLSTFLHKDKDSKDEKLYIGPIWDYNLAFGNADYCDGGETNGWAWDFNNVCNEDWWLIPFWWERFLRDPEYISQFKTRWEDLRNNEFSNETILQYIDSLAEVLEEPQQRNFDQWPILNDYIWPNNYIGGSYPNEIQYLKNWIKSRLVWLDTNIAALDIITGLNDQLQAKTQFTIFPNPSSGIINIKVTNEIPMNLQVNLHNQLGALVLTKSFNSDNSETNKSGILEFDSKLSQGVYLLNITDNKTINQTHKVVIR